MLLAWEWQYNLQEMHHLLVLCYHLQHPSLYSPEALEYAQWELAQFIEEGITPQQMLHEIRRTMQDTKIKGTPEHHGKYAQPIAWEMFIGDVVAAGHTRYYASVQQWARSILAS
ncbi:MAG: hypothetical protein KC496_01815, partial [Anaerolineae bacterium]|nr:hypothetical protein [Anaerolineae bacterium]